MVVYVTLAGNLLLIFLKPARYPIIVILISVIVSCISFHQWFVLRLLNIELKLF